MTHNTIVAEEQTYWYGELVAVDHISFNVAEGEILGFLGPNGAGKTTTIKMLTGQLRPKAGKATLLGMEFVELPTDPQLIGAIGAAVFAAHELTSPRSRRGYSTTTGR